MTDSELPYQFNEVFGLGAVKAVYPVKKAKKWGNLTAALGFSVITLALLIYAFWYSFQTAEKYGRIMFWGTLWPFMIGVGVFFLIALLAGWGAYTHWKKQAVLYEKGFAYRDRKGLKYMTFDEVDWLKSAVLRQYTSGIYTGTTHRYTIQKKDETRLVLDDGLQRVEELANAIRKQIYPALYTRASNAYNAGQTIGFGPLSLSRLQGIKVGKKEVAWEDVVKVEVDRGMLQVRTAGGGLYSGLSVPVASIQNVDVLVTIVDQVTGVNKNVPATAEPK